MARSGPDSKSLSPVGRALYISIISPSHLPPSLPPSHSSIVTGSEPIWTPPRPSHPTKAPGRVPSLCSAPSREVRSSPDRHPSLLRRGLISLFGVLNPFLVFNSLIRLPRVLILPPCFISFFLNPACPYLLTYLHYRDGTPRANRNSSIYSNYAHIW